VETLLAEGGKARCPIVLSDKASPRVQTAAAELAEYLGKITGAAFGVEKGDGATGIVVGVAADFPAIGLSGQFDPTDLLRREEYILRSHDKGMWLVGASDQAVENAVWDMLYRVGYRLFFPTDTWEVVPSLPALRVAVDSKEAPSFACRMISYDYGFWDYNRAPWDRWSKRNRMSSDLRIPCNHAYQAIVARFKKVFSEHSEYSALRDGKRGGSKMCLSNPETRKIILDYAFEMFEKKPDTVAISMEPSDGEGWCECAECAKMGPPSDRAAFVANMVSDAVTAKFGPRFVGMLAYGSHSAPPSIAVRPNVVVRATTHQTTGGFTHDQLMDGWRAKGARVGVSEAYCTYVWDHSLPAKQRGSDIAYLKRTIPHFRQKGAQAIGGWTSDSWGAVGLGNYLIARMIWDVREAERVDALVDDFLSKGFGPARAPMEKFFHLIYRMNGDDARPLLCEDMVGRMYRLLNEALALAGSPAVRARVTDLILFTRYVELYRAYASAAAGNARQAALEELLRFVYRTRKTEMVHAKAVWQSLPALDKTVSVPEGMTWGTPEAKHPWKSSEPVTEEEVRAILDKGIASNRLSDVTPVAYSPRLAPARALRLPEAPDGFAPASRMRPQRIFTWVDKAPASIGLTVSGGLDWQNRGHVRLSLRALHSLEDQEGETVSTDKSVPPDRKPHDVTLKTPREGLHLLLVETGGARAEVSFKDPRMPFTLESGQDADAAFLPAGYWSLYFYVPKNAKVVAGFAGATPQGRGTIKDGAGKTVFSFAGMKDGGYFKVPVAKGQGGTLWKFDNCYGQRLLLTVPPYLARNGAQLLLPQEVVEADSK